MTKLTLGMIENLEAGPGTDALIAEYVLGWKYNPNPISSPAPYWTVPGKGWPDGVQDWPPGYSTDIASAWDVIEQLNWGFYVSARMGNPLVLAPGEDPALCGMYSVWLTKAVPGLSMKESSVIATADELPLAICKASLKAALKVTLFARVEGKTDEPNT